MNIMYGTNNQSQINITQSPMYIYFLLIIKYSLAEN